MSRSPMLTLLEENQWGAVQSWFDRLLTWEYYPMLLDTLESLKHEALFVSKVHGLGHIERTILQGAFCAMEEPLNPADIELLMEACSYHDVGRVSDWMDELHGARAAEIIGDLTGREGTDLRILQAAVDAHSRKEKELIPTLKAYGLDTSERAMTIAQLLKDADGLDRVRLGDLNPAYLRREKSKERVELAQTVFDRYQALIGMPPGPLLDRNVVKKLKEIDELRAKSQD